MTTTAIRTKLFDYIRAANDKKIKAIYTILENEISETENWWSDKNFIKELDQRFADWETGKDKGYSLSEVKNEILIHKTA
jgi:hypothetical protein